MGSKRKRNTSSRASADPSHYAPDHVVLKRIDPSEADNSDDWPLFDLEDAVVLNSDGTEIENGLLVEMRGPFTVRGRLKLNRDDESENAKRAVACLRPDYKDITEQNIECRQCHKYSIGITNEGISIIYLSGPCGWFEIKPAEEYKAMYNHMDQCVQMYWSIGISYGVEKELLLDDEMADEEDEDENVVNEKAALPVDEVFLQYAMQIGDGSVKEDVMARCQLHAPFFLYHCHTNPDWAETEFFPLIKKLAKQNEEAPPSTPHLRTPKPAPTKMPRTEQNALSSSQQRDLPTRSKRGQGGSARLSEPQYSTPAARRKSPHAPAPSSPINLDPQPDTSKDAGSLYQEGLASVIAALSSYWDKPSPCGTWKNVCGHIFVGYSIKHFKGVPNQVAYYAKDLVNELVDPRWRGTEFSGQLKAEARKTWQPSELDAASPPFIFVKRRSIKPSKSGDRSGDDVGSPDVSMNGTATPPSVSGRGRGRPSGKTTKLRPSNISSKKRSVSSLDVEDSDDSHRSIKVPKRSHYFESRLSVETEDVDTADDRDSVKLVVEAEVLISSASRGPNGTWRCGLDGCGEIIRNSYDQEDRIRTHLDAHEDAASPSVIDDKDEVDDELIQIARAEGKQSANSINFLLEKIKNIGRAKAQQEIEVDGKTVVLPPPINGRVLV